MIVVARGCAQDFCNSHYLIAERLQGTLLMRGEGLDIPEVLGDRVPLGIVLE